MQIYNSQTRKKQEFVPKIILVSPPHIGPGIKDSPFYGAFDEKAVEESKKFHLQYEYYTPNNQLFQEIKE